MALDAGQVQDVALERDGELRRAAEDAGWTPTGTPLGWSDIALKRLHQDALKLGIETEDELDEAIALNEGADAYLRDIADFAERHGWNAKLGAEPYDVAFVLMVRSRGEGLNFVHEHTFGHDSLHIAVNEALEKSRRRP